MVQTIHELFAPVEHKGGVEGIMQHINTGIAVYDGVRTVSRSCKESEDIS